MKLLRCLVLLFAITILYTTCYAAADNLGPNAQGFSNDGEMGPEDEDDIDPKMLRKFIEDQGLIETRSKEGRLTIAGDVRNRWTRSREVQSGFQQRGFNEAAQTAVDLFKTEINLIMDYVAPTSWAEMKLKFAHYAGKDGGTAVKVETDRAWIGYEIYEDDDEELYIEVGRNRMDTLFDSKIQFTCPYDGILLTYRNIYEDIGMYDIHGGPMIIDSYSSHYAWIVETSLKKILNTGFSLKYSFVNWEKASTTLYYGNLDTDDLPEEMGFVSTGYPVEAYSASDTLVGLVAKDPQFRNNPRYRFRISQFLIGYEFEPQPVIFCKPSWFYLGALLNHAAEPILQTNFTKANKGWFIGYTFGKLRKQGDWSVDMNYQYVQMQAVPDFDCAGIGHGNALNVLFSDSILLGLDSGLARGFANYRGFEITALYAITDSLSVKTKYQTSRPVNKHIGGPFSYSNFEFSAIYAF